MNPGPRFYIPQVDGLRFLAFFFVFAHHLPPLISPEVPILGGLLRAIHDFGWAGVDLFLCLSGFLITRLLLLEWNATGKLRIPAFYVRRALRIWPLYFALLAFAFLILPRLGASPRYGELSYTRMAHLHGWSFPLFLGNWTVALNGYTPSSVLNPLWTVSLEEQFYLTWPLVVFVWLKNGRGVLGIAAIMLAASMAARVLTLLLHLPHPFMWAATITRLDPLAFGIALAGARAQQLIAHLSQRAALASLGAGVVAFAAAALAGPVERQSYASVTQYSATAIASACLLVGTLRHQGFARLLAAPALRYLGKISYGLYAFHLVVISAVHRLVSMSGVAASLAPLITFLLALSAVVFLSGLSYRYFETPFLHLKERFAIVRSRAV